MHDNSRVHAFTGDYLFLAELTEEHPALNDIFTGAVHLQTEGDSRSRPLLKGRLFAILSNVPFITAAAVAEALNLPADSSTARAYALAARVASKAIERLLNQRPWMELSGNQSIRAAQAELDAPYFAELRAQGLM